MSRLTHKDFDNNYYCYKTRDDFIDGYFTRENKEWFYGNVVDKLGEIEDLEEELGCPLDIFVSIMLGKIDEIVINYADACGYEPLYEELTLAKVDGIIDGCIHNCLCIDTNMCEVPVKDYHKNWWLKGENDE